MIRSKLPPIISCKADQDSVTWTLEIAADLEFFSGHFPEQPVLPGVTQLDWAIKLGCEHFGYPVNVATLEVLKFQQLMLPNTQVDLSISHNAAKAKLVFAYSEGDKRFASGRIALNSETTQVINSTDSH
ncbi:MULTISPECIES: thioester dehydrase [unclassified Shewanella]|uniref:ApeI family dehydratase n=1 Tax=unclassified Shewanella TaxID=196818 RepID=UPI001BC56634|nr:MULTISPECIES: thioester dehydrase [unclassified Shewanella]GIU11360.1 thioester dehydrase [Shewanella sp. MBTL60-112-B1]GIU31079.1 thioester dehydrase [Shewanella sp. MBTL60-112-B2]